MLPITVVIEAVSARPCSESHGESAEAHRPDIHRYFPEWADRQLRSGAYLEAGRNSYLAGGYAEEFGYGDERDCRVGACLIVADPERCCLWSAQIGGLHPGYPEYATPHQRDATGPEPDGAHRDRAADHPMLQPQGSEPPGDRGEVLVCRVREHVGPLSAILSMWRDLRIRRRGLNRFG
jgi:hypothetical protein